MRAPLPGSTVTRSTLSAGAAAAEAGAACAVIATPRALNAAHNTTFTHRLLIVVSPFFLVQRIFWNMVRRVLRNDGRTRLLQSVARTASHGGLPKVSRVSRS